MILAKYWKNMRDYACLKILANNYIKLNSFHFKPGSL